MLQRELAELTGLTSQYISDKCNNRGTMRIDHAMTIAHVLGCTIEELYEWKRSSTHKNGR
ncbi:XRE family transcriptional regulator [Diaphorobacter sp. DS2]|nr:XRE family transcriptional regulator [Diaphorobacter sp. DS2]